MTGGAVTSIRLTPEDRRLLERCVVESGMTRSCFFRRLLQDRANGMYGNVNHAISAAVLRSEIAGLANLQAPGGIYPAMTIRAYDPALVAARTSMDEILSGTLPMVGDDARTAGWDPYAEGTRWFYMRVLPKFFKTLLRLDRPPTVDARYEPFEMVDGQHAEPFRVRLPHTGQPARTARRAHTQGLNCWLERLRWW